VHLLRLVDPLKEHWKVAVDERTEDYAVWHAGS